MFINFQFYVMESYSSSPNSFIMLYSVLSGSFLLFVGLLFILSGKVFEDSRNEDIKEGAKLILKALSVLMCLFIQLLQIPLITMLF